MNENKLKAFAKQLVDIAGHLQTGNPPPSKTHFMSLLAGDKPVAMVDQHVVEFNEFNGKFYQESGWSDKYSEHYVTNFLRALLGKIYIAKTTSAAEETLENQASAYQSYQKRHTVLLPLTGIHFTVPSLKLGRVTIIQPSNQELVQRLGKNFAIGPGQHYYQAISGMALAEFQAVAEPVRAKEMAVEETRRALEILRYGIPFIVQKDYKNLGINVSIVGDFPESDCLTLVMPSDDDNSMTLTSDNNRPQIPLPINEDNLRTLNDCGALKASTFLEKPVSNLTDLERATLRGIHWFGSALCQRQAENELLNLTTCLETFLTPRDGNPIGTAIAEGVAILLSDNLDERKRLKKRVKDLYGKRSGVSHGGEKAVLDSDLAELREVAKRLIQTVITLQPTVNSQKALLNKIEDAKLG